MLEVAADGQVEAVGEIDLVAERDAVAGVGGIGDSGVFEDRIAGILGVVRKATRGVGVADGIGAP
ncbi:hypothetical protein D3C86_2088700 [compost metagenome]